MIPRVFHQIWINSKNPELPANFSAYRDGWLKKHPGWDYKLWNLENLDFTPTRLELLSKTKSYAQMADILRYEILFRHGGIYLDTDFECLRCIEPILTGVQNFSCSEDGRSISIGILGAVPGSVYMQRCIDALPKELGLTSVSMETGPGLMTKVLLGQGIASDYTLFPQLWFYPYNWDEPDRANEAFTEAYAVHRWAHSWKDTDKNIPTRIRRRLRKILGLGQ